MHLPPVFRRPTALLGVVATLLLCGCGGPPTLHPVSGKVTFAGKSYPRMLVYFRPAAGAVTMYNLAVGETDAEGKMESIKTAGGNGLQAGDYRVTFALYQDRKGQAVGGSDKPEEKGIAAKQVVPPPYDVETSIETTPVNFTVKSGQNTFEFDVPAK